MLNFKCLAQNVYGEPIKKMIGYSAAGRLLFVSFVQRRNFVVRIISARHTIKRERKLYEQKSKNPKEG